MKMDPIKTYPGETAESWGQSKACKIIQNKRADQEKGIQGSRKQHPTQERGREASQLRDEGAQSPTVHLRLLVLDQFVWVKSLWERIFSR